MPLGTAITTGLAAGLASTVHCATMCGPLAALGCRRRGAVWRYQLGRLFSYSLAGMLAGWGGRGLLDSLRPQALTTLLSGSVALLFAYQAWRLWPRSRPTGAVEQRATGAPDQPARQTRYSRVAQWMLGRPFTLGMATALLPCGMLAAALLLAAAAASPRSGAVTMAAFAISSAAGLVAAGALAPLLRRPTTKGLRATACLLLVAAAALSLLRPITVQGEHCHSPRQPHAAGVRPSSRALAASEPRPSPRAIHSPAVPVCHDGLGQQLTLP